MRPSRYALVCGLLLSASGAAFSQQFSFGAVVGAPLTSSVIANPQGFTFNSAHKYIIGPMVDFSLPRGLSVEGDFLFHPFNLEVGSNPPPGYTAHTLYDYHVYEIPLLLKAHFTNGLIRPFAQAGVSFRGSLNSINLAHYGFTAGGGFEVGQRHFIRVAPQIRYTRWGPDSLITVGGSRVSAEQANQLDVLIGVYF